MGYVRMPVGLNRAARSFRDPQVQKCKSDISQAPAFDASGVQLSRGQQLVREIYRKWRKQLQRYVDYRNLFLFLAFIALFLGVLYSQRDAHTSYQVHSTIASVVLPANNILQSSNDVYTWLSGLLQTVWKDPVCGDGVCEAPYEFASYGRFGCRADCGMLYKVQNLTTIQVDIYYDFTNPVISVSSADLMNQASWNLCPVKIQYNSDCYYAKDQTFTQISGEVHVAIPDAPDGDWDLVIKRDMFNKVSGAVRSTPAVNAAAFWSKVYIAAAAADAEQAYEMGLLQAAVNITNTPLLDYLPILWKAISPKRDAFDETQMRDAVCNCTDTTNITLPLVGTYGFVNPTDYRTRIAKCTGSEKLRDRTYDSQGNATIDYSHNLTTSCATALANLTTHYQAINNTLLSLLLNQRLGNLADTGKFAVRTTSMANYQKFLAKNFPELVAGIYTNPTGNDAQNDAYNATLAALANLYVESPAYLIPGAPANLALSRRRLLYDAGMTHVQYGARAAARIAEIGTQQVSVAGIQVTGPLATLAVADVKTAFATAGANATVLPAMTSISGPLNISYNLVAWQGNTTAYLLCNMPGRAPSYVGTCQTNTVACVATTTDRTPYNCTTLSTGATVLGNISQSSYREQCEMPCDRQLDCNSICECYGTCSSGQTCVCPACDNDATLHPDAARDSEFVTISTAVSASASASVSIADTTAPSGRRRLLQQTNADVTTALAGVAVKVDALQSSQASIGSQMTALQSQVDKANLLATARARDTSVLDLIKAGRSDIQSGQAVLVSKLNLLLDRQQQALDAVNKATATLTVIKDMNDKQNQALAALDDAVKSQISAISIATQQGVISMYTALALWKRARRDKALTIRNTRLASSPCQFTPVSDNHFTLTNGNGAGNDTARSRTVGLNNRLIAGMLLHTWRVKDAKCDASRFDKIQSTCSGGLDVAPYGVDPVFKAGSQSYNPDLDDPEQATVQTFYNCSKVPSPTYNITEKVTNLTVNPPPFCAELYNPRTVPWGFHHFALKSLPVGFPVWFDINLSQAGASTWYTWLSEGLLLDGNTRGMVAYMVTYNADLEVFAAVRVNFDFDQGGSIRVTNRIYTLRMELYTGTQADNARFAFEVMLTLVIGLMLLVQLGQILYATCRPKGLTLYFKSAANWVELVSNVLLLAAMGVWWTFVRNHAAKFSMALRYNVYQDLQPQAYFLKLNANGAELSNAWDAFYNLDDAIVLLNSYYALNGINIILLIARVLRMMDFQPRLGVVTRALALAAPDLIHFALVAGSVFISYCMMAYLIFGNSIQSFSTFGDSMNTCFEMLLGVLDVNVELRALGGLQGVAGALFFWTYMIVVFMVLLNFLLAIIVDAFSEIKEKTKETVGMHTELARLVLDKWRAMKGVLTKQYISNTKLDRLLHEWAGTEGLDESWYTKKGLSEGPKKLKVLGEAIDEATLRDILMECLEDNQQDKKVKEGTELQHRPATADDVSIIAHYIIKRFARGEKQLKKGEQAAGEEPPSPSARKGEDDLRSDRDNLAAALERLADVQRELAEAQRNLMTGQKQLASQQAQMVSFVTSGSGDGSADGSVGVHRRG